MKKYLLFEKTTMLFIDIIVLSAKEDKSRYERDFILKGLKEV